MALLEGFHSSARHRSSEPAPPGRPPSRSGPEPCPHWAAHGPAVELWEPALSPDSKLDSHRRGLRWERGESQSTCPRRYRWCADSSPPGIANEPRAAPPERPNHDGEWCGALLARQPELDDA